jgi:hypothetical protein
MAELFKLAGEFSRGTLSAADLRLRLIAALATLSDADLVQLALILTEEGQETC